MRLIISVIFLMFSVTSYVHADEYKFIVTANFTASSCTVSAENLTFNFYINDVDLQDSGSHSAWQALPGQTIKLFNCFSGTHSVNVSVSGTMDDDDIDGFKNQSATNPAKGVSVQLKSGETVLHNNDVISANINTSYSADIPLAARLYTAKGNVTPGDIYSVINLTLTYK